MVALTGGLPRSRSWPNGGCAHVRRTLPSSSTSRSTRDEIESILDAGTTRIRRASYRSALGRERRRRASEAPRPRRPSTRRYVRWLADARGPGPTQPSASGPSPPRSSGVGHRRGFTTGDGTRPARSPGPGSREVRIRVRRPVDQTEVGSGAGEQPPGPAGGRGPPDGVVGSGDGRRIADPLLAGVPPRAALGGGYGRMGPPRQRARPRRGGQDPPRRQATKTRPAGPVRGEARASARLHTERCRRGPGPTPTRSTWSGALPPSLATIKEEPSPPTRRG